MGGGVALDLAVQDMDNVKGLIVDAPSCNIEKFFREVAAGVFKKDGPKVAECAMSRFQKEFAADPRDFDRIENIKKGRYPLLLSAGSMENMEDILGKIQKNNPKETAVVILPGCNHGNGMYKQTEMYQSAIREFIDRSI